MRSIHGLGAFGISPYLSENIKTRAGNIAYLATAGKKRGKPRVEEGVHKARGALKWVASILEDEKEKKDEK